jgi:PKD repeat protein
MKAFDTPQRIFHIFIVLVFLNSGNTLQAQAPCATIDFSFSQSGTTIKLLGKSDATVQEWYWYLGDNTSKQGKDIVHTYDKAGEYEVCLKALISQDCAVGLCKKILVGNTSSPCELKADFTWKIDGGKLLVKGSSNDDKAQYHWTITDQNVTYSGQDVSIPLINKGTYEVCLTAVNGEQTCKVRVCQKVDYRDCVLEADYRFEQVGDVYVFTGKSTAEENARYYWSFGNGKSAEGREVKASFDAEGSYEVCLKVVAPSIATSTASASLCSTTVCKKIKISTANDCGMKPDFTYESNGTTVRFKGTSNDDKATYYWYLPHNNSQLEGKEVSLNVEKEGVYKMCMVAVNGSNTCKTEVCKPFTTGNRVTIYPNPATVVINIASELVIGRVLIYNQVYEQKLETRLDATHGTIDISALPEGVYLISMEASDNTLFSQKFYKRG